MLSDEAAKEQLAREMEEAKEPHVAAAIMDESWALLTPILRAMRMAYAAGSLSRAVDDARRVSLQPPT